MRKLLVLLALAASMATVAQAQNAWQKEIGIQGGFSRIKPAGSGLPDAIDVFALPTPNYVLGLLTNGSVYVIIPWQEKIALEPSLVFAQLNSAGSANTGRFGLRANYALSPKIYAAAGGELIWIETGGQQVKQLGLQAALGYRMRLIAGLNGRVEAHVAATKKTDDLGPIDVYSLLIGASTRLGGGASPARRPAAASGRAWQKVLGVQGGYISMHEVGGATDISGLTFPALGGSLNAIGTGSFIGGPPTLFAIFPIGAKTAIEPGLDIARVQQPGPNTGFSGNLSARLNYAVKGGWYGAAGGNLVYLKYSGVDAQTVTGANVAWGYRFGLSGTWGGRVEANYSLFGRNTDLGIAPQNTFGVMFGATVPIR